MSHIAFVSGRFIPQSQATTHICDRGYQFADAAYEVIGFIHKKPMDIDLHLDRLERTLSHLRIDFKISRRAFILLMETLLEKNRTHSGLIYIQISRGIAPRSHPFPKEIKPVFVMTVTPFTTKTLSKMCHKTLTVKTANDLRHKICDVKTVSLLPNVLAMQSALDDGYDDALLVDNNGNITEGTSWNFWIVTKDGQVKTRGLDNHILHGITRHTVLDCAKELEMNVTQGNISLEEALNAQEAFATSASKFVMPITKIDDIIMPEQNDFSKKLRYAYLQKFFTEDEIKNIFGIL